MDTRSRVFVSENGFPLGFCVYRDGWRFNSNVASHGPSRKAWATPEAAVPRWAKKRGGRLIVREEWAQEAGKKIAG